MRATALSAAVAALFAAQTAAPAAAGELPPKLTSAYAISFAGIKIGNFRFTSTSRGNRYALRGDANISAFLGAVTWNGKAAAEGTQNGAKLAPSSYNLDYRATKKKKGSLRLGFDRGTISKIVMDPPNNPSPEVVPVRPHHLKNVFDPLSAMVALSATASTAPCDRKVGIFDGKLRFDLVLTFNRQAPLPGKAATKSGEQAVVCSVRFIPVAGYKKDDTIRQMADTSGMEVWLRKVPAANVYVPHEVRVPTFAGHVVLRATRVDIVSKNNQQIALVN